jgi:hypothetical protein
MPQQRWLADNRREGALVTRDPGPDALAIRCHSRNPDGIVLIQDFIQVEKPFAEVRATFLAEPRALLVNHANAAYHEGEQLSMRLYPLTKHKHFGKRIVIDLGQPYERGGRLVLPIHWWAPGATRLYPRLEADLDVAPVGDGTTQITLMGRYDPPLAALGRGADRMLLHHIAEASIRSFLAKIARALEDSAARATRRLEHAVPVESTPRTH